jgi:carboxypeptidase Q
LTEVNDDSRYDEDMLSRRRVLTLGLLLAASTIALPAQDTAWLDAYRDPVSKIIAEATKNDFAWQRLAYLTDTFGNRLAGSQALADAIDWAVAEMAKDGLDHVRLDAVKVPHWVRGAESLEVTAPHRLKLPVLGLGLSVGTPAEGIEADALVVDSFLTLEQRASEARGKIVVFNQPFKGYGPTVAYRVNGASQAAEAGALAVLIRSVGLDGLRTLHTGMLTYREGVPKIPAAAISGEDADRLSRMAARGERIRLKLTMGAEMLPDADSANVIAEIRGREKPEEVVVVGGHFDSWDVGAGATDDGGGAVAAWEVARLLKRLDLKPRRTIRVVLFTNEENGLRGGLDYRDRYRADLSRHVLMMESDAGVFAPVGFGLSANETARAQITAIASLLVSINATHVAASGGGADIGPSVTAGRIPAMSLDVDGSKYFLIHHTEADTIDKIEPGDLAKCAAAMASMAYVVADMPTRLGEAAGTR